MDPQAISTFLATWGYPALFALLLVTAIGSPIPEDLLLLTAGYLVFSDVFWWAPALAVSVAGVVSSDLMLYSAGRHLAWRSARLPEARVLSPERLQRATRWFDRIGDRLVFIARLVPGTRAMVFIAAGARAVSVARFLLFDLLGALLWVPAMLWAGHAIGSSVGQIDDAVAVMNRSAAWVVVIVIVLVMAWFAWGREESKL